MASDLTKHLPLPTAADLTRLWEAPVKPFFSPEDVKRAGGMGEFFKAQYLTPPPPPEEMSLSKMRVLTSARRSGKSVLANEYYKMMAEDMSAIAGTLSAREFFDEKVAGGKSITIIMDELADLDAGKIMDLEKDMANKLASERQLSPEAVLALEYMAQQMTTTLGAMLPGNRRVTIAGPGSLTVNGATGYRKRNHLGGEEFVMVGVRVGSPQKGHRLIFEFEPTSVAEYKMMEMTQQECESNLNDWRGLVDSASTGSNFYVALEEVRKVDAAKIQAVENERLAQEYGEFGAW